MLANYLKMIGKIYQQHKLILLMRTGLFSETLLPVEVLDRFVQLQIVKMQIGSL